MYYIINYEKELVEFIFPYKNNKIFQRVYKVFLYKSIINILIIIQKTLLNILSLSQKKKEGFWIPLEELS